LEWAGKQTLLKLPGAYRVTPGHPGLGGVRETVKFQRVRFRKVAIRPKIQDGDSVINRDE